MKAVKMIADTSDAAKAAHAAKAAPSAKAAPAGSARGLCYSAISEGNTSREDIVTHCLEHDAEGQFHRKKILKALSNEILRVRVPLWATSDGGEYSLTEAGMRDGKDDDVEEQDEEEQIEADEDEEDEDEEAEDDDDEKEDRRRSMLAIGSVRWLVHRALCAGHSERSDIVDAVSARRRSGWARRQERECIVTVLGREKRFDGRALWSQDGTAYALTEEGEELRPSEETMAEEATELEAALAMRRTLPSQKVHMSDDDAIAALPQVAAPDPSPVAAPAADHEPSLVREKCFVPSPAAASPQKLRTGGGAGRVQLMARFVKPACIMPDCDGKPAPTGLHMLTCGACGVCWQSSWWHAFLTSQPPPPPRGTVSGMPMSVPQAAFQEQAAGQPTSPSSDPAPPPKDESSGPSKLVPPPPPGWLWPFDGEQIEVLVDLDGEAGEDEGAAGAAAAAGADGGTSSAFWCMATVGAVLVDGWFSALITLPDGSDEWTDWFTWQEETVDWRRTRRERQAVKANVASPKGKRKADGGGPSSITAPSLQEHALVNSIKAHKRLERAERRSSPDKRSPLAASKSDDDPWMLVGGAGIDVVPLSRIRADAQAKRLADRKRPRELAHLQDFFTNGPKGIP